MVESLASLSRTGVRFARSDGRSSALLRTRVTLGVAALIFLVGGCTGGSEGDSPSSSGGGASDDWNLSEADLEAAYQAYADSQAELNLIDDPPPVERIRFVSAAEWPQAQVDCLNEAGFAAEVRQGGVAFDQVPGEQGPQLNLAAYTCSLQYAIDPRVNMQWPTKRAEMQYEYVTTTVRECVEGLGYSVDDPPSVDVWLSDYCGKRAIWDPFQFVAEQAGAESAEALDEAYAECPQFSPDLYPPLS